MEVKFLKTMKEKDNELQCIDKKTEEIQVKIDKKRDILFSMLTSSQQNMRYSKARTAK